MARNEVFMEEPTFTLEEFVYSWVPGVHWVPKNLEALGYTTAKIATGVLPVMGRATYLYQFGYIAPEIIAMHGGRWTAAGFIATQESFTFFRLISKAARAGRFLTSPAGLLLTAAVTLAYAIPDSSKPPPDMTVTWGGPIDPATEAYEAQLRSN